METGRTKRSATRKQCKKLLEKDKDNYKERAQVVERRIGRRRFRASKKVLWNIAHTRVLEGRGAVSKEDGDLFREYQTMREENFLSSWLRDDVEVTTRRRGHEQKSQRRKVKVGYEG